MLFETIPVRPLAGVRSKRVESVNWHRSTHNRLNRWHLHMKVERTERLLWTAWHGNCIIRSKPHNAIVYNCTQANALATLIRIDKCNLKSISMVKSKYCADFLFNTITKTQRQTCKRWWREVENSTFVDLFQMLKSMETFTICAFVCVCV